MSRPVSYTHLDVYKRQIKYRNPILLAEYIREKTSNKNEKYYLFVDEIQLSDEVDNPYSKGGKKITFYDTLNELRECDNLDVYVTGSNSKMLSSDILTEFRGRSDEVRVRPVSYTHLDVYKRQGYRRSLYIGYSVFKSWRTCKKKWNESTDSGTYQRMFWTSWKHRLSKICTLWGWWRDVYKRQP